jgi:hypothetical protein
MPMRSVARGTVFAFIFAAAAACNDKTISPPPMSASPAPIGASASSAASASKPIRLVWKARKHGESTKLRITLVADEQPVDLGEMDATSDEASSGTPAACSIAAKESTKTSSRFGCGGTPAYHFYTASLRGGALVVTLTEGVEGERGSEKVKEIKRIPTTAAALEVRPFRPAKPAPARDSSAPTCPKGSFAAEGGCVKECASDADCASPQVCEDIHYIEADGSIGPLLGRGCQ